MTEADPRPPVSYGDRIRSVTFNDVMSWFRAGVADFVSAGWISVAYGGMFVAIGFGITAGLLLAGMPYLISPMIGGFLLIGPLLCLGLYQISKDLDEGRKPNFWRALTAWRANPYHILTAGVIVMLFVMIWARLSVVAFALFFPFVTMTFESFLAQMLTWDGIIFMLFITALGFCFAVVAYVTNVIALPMMLDRDTDFFGAAFHSLLAVSKNPRPLAAWAVLITIVTGAGLLTAFVGLAIALPIIGHASWHAYRALIKPEEEW